ncbi:MAG: HD domain-containing protein [Gemmatimonadota bacterium]|nr:HD domain-containing protein [Gemmatimonadota bacterium]
MRDALAGGHPGDWDLATRARPGDVQRLFRRTVPVGVEHGTVGVLDQDSRMYEVTTFRRDVETDGRHARVAFAQTIEEDLSRRDFTINAIAWHPLTHEVRDPYGGRRDLEAGRLRTVGEPRERFREDRLRVLRALRFAGRFGLKIDPATWEAACAVTPEFGALSAERIREELRKTLQEVAHPSDTLQLYAASGALRVWYPELQACVGVPDPGAADVWTHLLNTTDAVPRHRVTLRLAALLHDIGRPVDPAEHALAGAALADRLLRRLRASNVEIGRVVHLTAQHADLPRSDASDADLRRWLQRVGPKLVPDLLRLRIAKLRARGEPENSLLPLIRRVRRVLRDHPPLEIGDLALGGRELIELGVRPGPRLGEVLRGLLDQVLENPALNTPDQLGALVRRELV